MSLDIIWHGPALTVSPQSAGDSASVAALLDLASGRVTC